MKQNNFFNRILKVSLSLLFIVSLALLASCDDDDPIREDTPELITKATLTFTPIDGAPTIVTATDPDGEGVQNITVDGPISLAAGKTYKLKITLINGLADPSSEAYDITAEVQEESDEHFFFFGWSNNVFATPAGNGNIDNRADAVTYDDTDSNGLPVGLETSWVTSPSTGSGTFHVILKHQPDLKSATSTSLDGESDLDVEFVINIK